jgi:adenine-specific DNA-methyltransferase
MATRKPKPEKKPIEQYAHPDKLRLNNPPVGLVTADSDQDGGKKTYSYDPHLDPSLQWAGKAEHTSFEVPTVSLHVHERIDPRTIIDTVRKKGGTSHQQFSLFEQPSENPPLREAIEFYKHRHNWSNRLIAGDSLLVMNSLLEKEGMAGKVQMVYIDPPYGIRYGSNFQPFINKRDVRDGKDEDLTAEPEMLRAFRDTWELGIHSYLTYLRDRVLLARELLSETGSCFIQISDENVHLVRNLMDEVFGTENYYALVSFFTTPGLASKGLNRSVDYLVWYAKDKSKMKYRDIYLSKDAGEGVGANYSRVELPDGTRRPLTADEVRDLSQLPKGSRLYLRDNSTSGAFRENTTIDYYFQGTKYHPGANRCWKTTREGLDKLTVAGRLEATSNSLYYVRYIDDFPVVKLSNSWSDTSSSFMPDKVYVVQTTRKVIERCMLLTTDPGDLVLDPTCGSGTSAVVAEQWGRRWVTCDTSRVAITLAKQRLMTAMFDYYELARPNEGVGSGFVYKTVPHITLGSIANNPDIRLGMTREQIDRAIARYAEQETLYDQPIVDKNRVRVTGSFTVEAVPAPMVKALDDIDAENVTPADNSVSRSGETLRQHEWRDELLKAGIRGKGGQKIEFTRVEPFSGTRWLHAAAETKDGQAVAIVFGHEHAPLEQRHVEMAIEEAARLVPKPKVIVFAAFQFDPEAAKDIDETNFPGVTLLKAQMNTDLLTEDLKKKRASNESFWLIGQPDVHVSKIRSGSDKGKFKIEVRGFDYYNTKTGTIESGGTAKIALWMLDTDYDGRSLFARQVFFPMAGEKDGWARLAKNLKAEIDEELIGAYRGTVSLPFEAGKHQRAAVKIVDDRGIESLKLLVLE